MLKTCYCKRKTAYPVYSAVQTTRDLPCDRAEAPFASKTSDLYIVEESGALSFWGTRAEVLAEIANLDLASLHA